MTDNDESKVTKNEAKSSLPPITELQLWQWRFLVFVNICFLLFGQGVAVLLIRFYYEKGGHSKWAATLAQNAGFPILFIPFILFPKIKEPYTKCPMIIVMMVYFGLGALIAASLVGVSDHSTNKTVSHTNCTLGLVATVGASGLYALLLSLTQLSFQKIIKKETFAVVLELQIHTSIIASCVSLVGLFASGEWRLLRGEVTSFDEGSLSYAMTLILTAVAWQICSVGAVGLIFVVSSLFSNVISTLALCLSPLAAAIGFDHSLNGVKIVAVLLGIWGFSTYVYQNCLDYEAKNKHEDDTRAECSC
ncbi:hypothetical protein E3N88_04480 [Mikania micrantha]|uniref:Probable purine permease n=1 Tax=Mikania micrantha TaxID=192012 RepID=A0A5N6PV37_9ASTR|nr:hypothetical protein E3N88_04480 [Mikania micrantha]